MARRLIVTDEDPLLRKVSREVGTPNDRTRALLDDMIDTLLDAEGVGLAAPQVGILRRIFIINVGIEEGRDEFVEFIDPVIVETSGEQDGAEGCLSVPGRQGNVKRPNKVTVEATDRNGNRFTYTGTELMARCLCHEYDHLDGILYTSRAERMLTQEELESGEIMEEE